MNQSPSSTCFLNKHTAVLFLPAPPESGWYLKKIAGVPFLLRNILTLQGLGVEKLVVWTEEPVPERDMFLSQLKQIKDCSWSLTGSPKNLFLQF